MSESIFGKGIPLATGFDLGAEKPLDSRLVVNTFDELQEHIENGRAYEGMLVYVIEDKKSYLYNGEKWVVGTGSATFHKGETEPEEKDALWVDTSTPSNLTVTKHNDRIRSKLVRVVDKVIEKTNELQENLTSVEERIDKISSDNVNKATKFRARLSDIRSSLTILKRNLDSTANSLQDETQDIKLLKGAANDLRRNVKELFFNLIDLDDEVIKLLESENNMIVQPDPDKPDNPDTPVEPDVPDVVDGSAMLTEEGLILMTEDGLILLLDGVRVEETVSEDALMTESGLGLLTEDGRQILRG